MDFFPKECGSKRLKDKIHQKKPQEPRYQHFGQTLWRLRFYSNKFYKKQPSVACMILFHGTEPGPSASERLRERETGGLSGKSTSRNSNNLQHRQLQQSLAFKQRRSLIFEDPKPLFDTTHKAIAFGLERITRIYIIGTRPQG